MLALGDALASPYRNVADSLGRFFDLSSGGKLGKALIRVADLDARGSQLAAGHRFDANARGAAGEHGEVVRVVPRRIG